MALVPIDVVQAVNGTLQTRLARALADELEPAGARQPAFVAAAAAQLFLADRRICVIELASATTDPAVADGFMGRPVLCTRRCPALQRFRHSSETRGFPLTPATMAAVAGELVERTETQRGALLSAEGVLGWLQVARRVPEAQALVLGRLYNPRVGGPLGPLFVNLPNEWMHGAPDVGVFVLRALYALETTLDGQLRRAGRHATLVNILETTIFTACTRERASNWPMAELLVEACNRLHAFCRWADAAHQPDGWVALRVARAKPLLCLRPFDFLAVLLACLAERTVRRRFAAQLTKATSAADVPDTLAYLFTHAPSCFASAMHAQLTRLLAPARA
jgi:hypothetical protein